MASSGKAPPIGNIQGVALMDLVIAHVREDPGCISGLSGERLLRRARPVPPDALDSLTFPGGKPLSPSLKRWLAFDASWLYDLGWFAAPDEFTVTPRPLDEIVEEEFGCWGETFASLGKRLPECFLLPRGTDSHRVYAICKPDTMGEYPVLVVETGDIPYVGVMYPGFDVFMADEAGLLHIISSGDTDTCEALFNDPRYAPRMRQHAAHLFRGKQGVECYDAEWDTPWPQTGPADQT
ncbi:MAG: hypothetical protein ACXVDA_12060 [Ktedonobacterales bacterium]